jgi:hypothetical protein
MNAADALTTAASLLTGVLWMIALATAALLLFAAWTLEVVADKEGESRWLAWVPVANGYLLCRLAGLSNGASALVLGGSAALLAAAGLLSAALGAWFFLLVLAVWGLGVWLFSGSVFMSIARRRGAPAALGLVCAATPLLAGALALPWLLPLALAPLGCWLYVVFHDGTSGHLPHPAAVPASVVLLALAFGPLGLLTRNVSAFNDSIEHELEAVAAVEHPEGLFDPGEPELLLVEIEPAAPAPELEDLDLEPPDASLELVSDDSACPPGTRVDGARFPAGLEIFCRRIGTQVRHGPIVEWHGNGELKTRGFYADDLESGVWIRYWDNGVPRIEAHFERGRQHGRMILYDAMGFVRGESHWRDGEPLPRQSPIPYAPDGGSPEAPAR